MSSQTRVTILHVIQMETFLITGLVAHFHAITVNGVWSFQASKDTKAL